MGSETPTLTDAPVREADGVATDRLRQMPSTPFHKSFTQALFVGVSLYILTTFNIMHQKQSTLTKWLQPKRAEIQANIAEHLPTYYEGEGHRTKPGTTKLTNTKEFNETKNAWTNTGIVSYNGETLGKDATLAVQWVNG